MKTPEGLRRACTTILLRYRWIPVVCVHLALAITANYVAFWLRFDGRIPSKEMGLWLRTIPILIVLRGMSFLPFRLYQGLWRYTSIWDLRNIIGATILSSAVFAFVVRRILDEGTYPRSIFVVDALLLIVSLGGIRLTRRVYAELVRNSGGKRVLVFGAGDAGEMVVRDMRSKPSHGYAPVGFVDDDTSKVGRRIHGVPVLGTREELRKILKDHRADEILIAIPGADPANMRSIVRALEPFKIPIKTLPKLRDIIDGKVELGDIRSLAVEDLLTRAPVGLDRRPVKSLIQGRRVMVTGAGGSIGSELCRQIVRLRPASLVMFERYENSLHAIRMELEDARAGLHPVIGDVADTVCVTAVMQRYRPEIVFHAAAHKHVPLMEENPCEAIKNNVRGTRLLAQAAEFHGVDRFILISTDKAVNPTSVMGASKRLAELAVQTQALGSGTAFSIVRFGNVLGSNGSVVPRFLDQIKKGGPVTITHPEMRRFFMLIPEAVQLVLHAAAQAESGATYVLEMGEQVKLLDMARDLIRLSGLIPEEDIPIEFIGLRPGEKLYEELVGANEDVGPSSVEKILRVTSRVPPTPDLLTSLEALERQAAAGDVEGVIAGLKMLIPEYTNPALADPVHVPMGVTNPVRETALSDVSADIVYQHCPNCESAKVRRSKSHGILERIKRGLTDERPFRCDECGWRGWLVPLVFSESTGSDALDAPDLATLDRVTAASPPAHRPAFAPRNLQ